MKVQNIRPSSANRLSVWILHNGASVPFTPANTKDNYEEPSYRGNQSITMDREGTKGPQRNSNQVGDDIEGRTQLPR